MDSIWCSNAVTSCARRRTVEVGNPLLRLPTWTLSWGVSDVGLIFRDGDLLKTARVVNFDTERALK